MISAANHSCDPNVFVVFDGPIVSMRTLKPVAKDEELFVAYIDSTNSLHKRQQELMARFAFDCRCRKCQSDSASSGADKSADSLFSALESARQTSDRASAMRRLESILRQCSERNSWPLTQQPYAATRDELFASLCANNDLWAAMHHGIKRYFLIDSMLYPQPFHPVRVVHTWALLKVMMSLYDQADDANVQKLMRLGFDMVVPLWRLAKEVAGLVEQSHGRCHFANEVIEVASDIRNGITAGDPRNLELIESDPERHWQTFKSWKDILTY